MLLAPACGFVKYKQARHSLNYWPFLSSRFRHRRQKIRKWQNHAKENGIQVRCNNFGIYLQSGHNIQEPGALPVSQAAEVGVGKNVSHIHLLTMPGLKHEDSLELQISQKKECAKRS